MFENCLQKQSELKKKFLNNCVEHNNFFESVIQLGKQARTMPASQKIEDNKVPGCQSVLYISVQLYKSKLLINVDSDSLFTLGLAQILVEVYHNEPVQAPLHCPLDFLNELGFFSAVSPSRVNGFQNLCKKFKQKCLSYALLNV